ncbi:MAG: transposase [Candidatus Loosdrechtia sp.]|uniref:transposase n=1 Tax=Candidatus Loosdrechtia sp. TaxID=3101272 RepID=UPI003A70877E|nr:MAG: transposase [Candidatus Jettenia sp. AMX2]
MDIVRIFSTLGYTSIGKIYIDGTKLKGNASAKRTKDRAGFEKWLSEIEEEVATVLKEAETIDKQEDESCKTDPELEALQKNLSDRACLRSKIEEALEAMKEEGKKKINLTDRDANHMKSGGSKDIRPGYNCQMAVTEAGIIVGAEPVTDANDRNQLKPVIEQAESNTQEKIKEVAADCGYGSYANYEYLEQRQREIDGYVFSTIQIGRV